MSLELCILASGSSGNCSAVRTPAGVMLIDLGLGPRSTAQRLCGTGVVMTDIRAVCVTHLDSDHYRPTWTTTLIRNRIRLFVHEACVDQVLEMGRAHCAEELRRLITPFHATAFEPLAGMTCQPVSLAHDRQGSHGFVVEVAGDGDRAGRLGYATDLGHVPAYLLEAFAQVDLLAIESNYDPQMQLASPRPAFLKKRIMGGSGHLSNQQAFDAVRALFDRAGQRGGRLPDHVALLHRSRQCNCPDLVRKFFSRDPRIAARLTLSDQFTRTEWLRRREVEPACGEQLLLGWG